MFSVTLRRLVQPADGDELEVQFLDPRRVRDPAPIDAGRLGVAVVPTRENGEGRHHATSLLLQQWSTTTFVIHDADESRLATLMDLLSGRGQGRVSAGPPDPTGCDLVCNALG